MLFYRSLKKDEDTRASVHPERENIVEKNEQIPHENRNIYSKFIHPHVFSVQVHEDIL
jgi:hypothetical protein